MRLVTGIAVLIIASVIISSPAAAGTRADLSGDFVLDFQSTMDMPFMTVGNPGNPGEESGFLPPVPNTGAVEYVYRIGKFEVTSGQYTEFLNAVAADDTYALYDPDMWDNGFGCKIQRSGSPGGYAYAVAADREDRPVNLVNWGDAARFCNWLTNGKPTGGQELATTEDGSYFLNGALSDVDLMAVTRRSQQDGGRYYIPTEDEWYKAAYHANDGATGNFYAYPTGTDDNPSNDLIDPDPGNNANFSSIGDPYYRTEVGEFENSPSPYGTFDMGGNLREWNEALYGDSRGFRGGSYIEGSSVDLFSGYRYGAWPSWEDLNLGFRVAEVPEPATLSLLLLSGLTLLKRRR